MNFPKLSTNQQYPNEKPLINITSWMRNQIAKFCNAALALMVATPGALAERL